MAKAFDYLRQSLEAGYSDVQSLLKDPNLVALQAMPEWNMLMKKYLEDLLYYHLACEQSLKGQLDKAFEALEISLLSKGRVDYNWMQNDTDLAPLRAQSERWKALMKKHFPDKFKD